MDSTTLFEPYDQQKDLHELTTLCCEPLRKVVRDRYWKILVEEITRFEDGHATYWERDLDQRTVYVNKTTSPGT